MKKRIADIVIDVLIKNTITECFMVVGGGAMHLNNAFALREDIHKIFNHHEQACAMAAEAYARASGKMAVVCVTSGPGGLNTLTGVEGAWVDSIPMLIISGQTRYETSVEITGLPLRTRGVQEFDITQSVANMTKYAKKIKNPLEIEYELQKAINIAMTGRRGPVWIEIPLDIQGCLIDEGELYPVDMNITQTMVSPKIKDVEEVIALLKIAERPCILTGSGIRSSNTVEQFRQFCTKLKLPILGGALQADILYEGFPNYYGMTGTVGPRAGNIIIQNADLILVLGNSLSFKQTGFYQEGFASQAKIIMVDVDESEPLKPGLKIFKFLHADLSEFFRIFIKQDFTIQVSEAWSKYCTEIYSQFPVFEFAENGEEPDRISIYQFWNKFYELEDKESIITLGNSNCVVGKLQRGICYPAQRVLVNYNCGSMGDDLPEAIGAFAALNKTVICITGDGSIMMNIQELQTIVHNNMPIKIIVFSNDGYGAIRQTNKNFFEGLYIGCDNKSGISFPEFSRIAEAFQIPYRQCQKVCDLEPSIRWLNEQSGYVFLEIVQKINDPIIPKIMSRIKADQTFETPALHDMFPFMKKIQLEGFMLMERKI